MGHFLQQSGLKVAVRIIPPELFSFPHQKQKQQYAVG